MLDRLIKDGHMPRGVRYSEMESAFAQAAQVAMMINGPWAWDNARKVGIDIGVAPIPSIGGKAGKPFRRRARLHDHGAQQDQGHRARVSSRTTC